MFFSFCVIPIKVEKAYTKECINVMIQVLQAKDGSLPQGLTIQNAYTELQKESSGAQGSGHNHGVGTTAGDQGTRGRGWTSEPPST